MESRILGLRVGFVNLKSLLDAILNVWAVILICQRSCQIPLAHPTVRDDTLSLAKGATLV
jgi:hypothetical protein